MTIESYPFIASFLKLHLHVYIFRGVACASESRDDAPAAAAKGCGERYRRDVDHSPENPLLSANGERCRGDVDHSAEVPPPSSADDGPVNGSEPSAGKQPSSREEEAAREQQRAALKSDCDRNMGSTAIGACGASGSSFKNVVMVTESFKTAMN